MAMQAYRYALMKSAMRSRLDVERNFPPRASNGRPLVVMIILAGGLAESKRTITNVVELEGEKREIVVSSHAWVVLQLEV